MRGIAGFRIRMADWIALLALGCVAADWQIAAPGWQYDFPRDHHAHDQFKTEWWYFTGNLTNNRGQRFGYELTFFRQGIRPPIERAGTTSRFIVDDLKFAHFTVTDPAGKRFLFHQKVSRGSFGDAGFGDGNRLAWIDSWNLRMNADGSFDLAADALDAAIQLHLVAAKTAGHPWQRGNQPEGARCGPRFPLLLAHAAGDVWSHEGAARKASRSRARAGSTTNGQPTSSRRDRPVGIGSRRSSRTGPS